MGSSPDKTHFLSCRRGRPVASPGYKWDVRVTMPILASGRGRVAEGSISGYEAGRVLGGTSYPSIRYVGITTCLLVQWSGAIPEHVIF